jgi:flavin reductase (DIM6/NTAB) family NADH-FMN oxidoreductase RutF
MRRNGTSGQPECFVAQQFRCEGKNRSASDRDELSHDLAGEHLVLTSIRVPSGRWSVRNHCLCWRPIARVRDSKARREMSLGTTEKSSFSKERFGTKTNESADPVTYPAVVSTINANRSPLLSEVVPVVIYGLRLTVNLPRQSTTANNLMRTGECVINLPGAETIAAVERLAQTGTSINNSFDFSFSRVVACGGVTPAHMTLVPSEVVSALRALECPMQLEARIEGNVDAMADERVAPLNKSLTVGLTILRVHLDTSVVLSDVHPNAWTPLMARLREAYRTSPAN